MRQCMPNVNMIPCCTYKLVLSSLLHITFTQDGCSLPAVARFETPEAWEMAHADNTVDGVLVSIYSGKNPEATIHSPLAKKEEKCVDGIHF